MGYEPIYLLISFQLKPTKLQTCRITFAGTQVLQTAAYVALKF